MGGRNELARALDSCIQRPNNNPEGEEKIQSGRERRKDNDSDHRRRIAKRESEDERDLTEPESEEWRSPSPEK